MLPTHWAVARAFISITFIAAMAIGGWHLGGIMSKPDKATLILTAQRAGYVVREDAEYGGWVIDTPAAPRHPSQTLASYKTPERAWMAAASLALQDD